MRFALARGFVNGGWDIARFNPGWSRSPTRARPWANILNRLRGSRFAAAPTMGVEVNASNVPQMTFTRGNDLSGSLQGAGGIGGLLARTTFGQELPGAPTTIFYHADGNGNITALIYPDQQLAALYHYDPFGNMLSMCGPLDNVNKYRFSSKEWNDNAGLYYYLYRFYDPSLQRWPNRDPLDEPGFETMQLVTQPLSIRKLRLGINDAETRFFLAMAIQSGIRGAPNWPVELLEGPNLFDFVGNDPLYGIDPFGNAWYNPPSWFGWTWEMVWDWLEQVGSAASDKVDAAVTALDTCRALHDIYHTTPNIRNGQNIYNQFYNNQWPTNQQWNSD